MFFGRVSLLTLGLALAVGAVSRPIQRPVVGWPTHGGNSRHTATSSVRAQNLNRIVWSTPMDLNPQYNGDVLYAHYGSPVVSGDNVVILPVKTGASSGFKVEARSGETGALLWQQDTDYVVPNYNWFPIFGPTIMGKKVVYARKGGLLGIRNVDGSGTETKVCFYGMAKYQADPAAYDAAIRISSPLVTAEDGSVVFTYRVQGNNPLGLKGGLAVIRVDGGPAYIEGAVATRDAEFVRPKLNGAPAVSNGTIYTVFKKANGAEGKIVAVNLKSMRALQVGDLLDPRNGNFANTDEEGTACPMVGPDGDVYVGVLENPFGTHNYRGWLLHFSPKLTPKLPGSFGWDDAPSLIPRELVPSYTGTSAYLVMTKYNNYAGRGDGVNKMAVVDPRASQTDAYSTASVMKEVLTKVGPTPDAGILASHPNAVREWCVNTAAIDLLGHAALVNNEDGYLYRWNLDTNTLDQKIQLNSGIGQAYTSTLIGPTGLTFAVSNARLYAVGQ